MALSAAGITLFGLFFQHVFYGDAPLQLVSYRGHQPTGHRLHYFVTEAFGALGLSPLMAIRAASFVPAGIALGILFIALVRAGASRMGALLATLLLAFTPSALFFATTVEVHGLQLFGASLALLCAIHMVLPRSASVLGLLGWSLLAVVSLGATHPMNLQAGLGLGALFLVGLRARGTSLRRTVGIALVAGALVVGVALLVSYGYLDRQGWSVGILIDSFKWHFDKTGAGSELPAPFANGWNTVVKPAAYLLAAGLLGLLALVIRPRAESHERGLGAGLLIWVLAPALILMGPDFTERGAYFLVALPALALGAAVLATRSRGLALLLVALIVPQARLATEAIRSWDEPVPEEARAWLDGLAAVSKGRGVLLAEDAQQQDWARRYLGMPADNLRLFLPLPEPELRTFAVNFASYAKRRASFGEPLFVPARILELAPEIPPLGMAVNILKEEIDFTPVEAAGFRGYKGE